MTPQQTEGLTAELLPCPFCGKEAGKCKLACCGNGSSGDGCCGNPVEQFCPLESLEVLHAHSLKTAATESFYQSHNQEMDEHLRIVCAAYMAAMRAASVSRPSPPAQEAVAFVAPGTMCTLLDMQRLGGIDARDIRVFHRKTDIMSEPLYTYPPSQSSLIKVLTEALENAKGLIDTPYGRRQLGGSEFYQEVADSINGALALVKEAK